MSRNYFLRFLIFIHIPINRRKWDQEVQTIDLIFRNFLSILCSLISFFSMKEERVTKNDPGFGSYCLLHHPSFMFVTKIENRSIKTLLNLCEILNKIVCKNLTLIIMEHSRLISKGRRQISQQISPPQLKIKDN